MIKFTNHFQLQINLFYQNKYKTYKIRFLFFNFFFSIREKLLRELKNKLFKLPSVSNSLSEKLPCKTYGLYLLFKVLKKNYLCKFVNLINCSLHTKI